jgi:TP901 family phage tail tape measure protein
MGKAEQLAVANNANLNTTVDLLTGTMNAYGYTINDVGHLNDVFFQSTLIGKQTIDSLGQSMGNVVGIAANFGVSFEELSGAIATLTAKGMETSEAITAVKGVITTIVSPSKEAAEAARTLGLDFSASSLKAQGFGGILSSIMNATGGSADKMAVLFNEVRALNGVMQLTGDGMTFFNNAMQQINNSTGASESAYKKMVETFSNQSQMLINNARNLMIDIGTKLEPIAAGIAGSFSGVLGSIDLGVKAGAFDPLFKLLDDAGKELSTWLSGVAKAMPDALKGLDFSKLTAAFRGLGEAFGKYFGDLDLTKPKDLHEFIQKIIDGIAGLIRVTEGMVKGFEPFFNAIKDFLLRVAESDTETQKMIGTIMTLGKMVQDTCLYFVAAVMVFDQYGMTLKGVFSIIAGGTQIIWNLIQATVRLGEMSVLVMAGRITEIPAIFQKMRADGDDFGRGLEKIVGGFNQLGSKAPTIQELIDGVGDNSSRARAKIDELSRSLFGVPADTKAKISVDGADLEVWKKELLANADKWNVPVRAVVDKPSFKDTEDTIHSKFGGGQMIKITANLDGSSTIAAINKFNAAVPAAKTVELKPDITQTAVAEIKGKADIIQKSIEWKAKIDIAQIEAATKVIESAFKSINVTVESTGKTITDLTGTYAGVVGAGKGGNAVIEQMIREENTRRDQALNIQKDLVQAQVDNMRARTEAMRQGQAMIQIDGKGLQPQLEAFMFEVLKAIQVRANAEGAQYLVGI